MRWLWLSWVVMGCGTGEPPVPPSFVCPERLESRPLPTDPALRPGTGVDTVSWTTRSGASCPSFLVRPPMMHVMTSLTFMDVKPGDPTESLLARHFAGEGLDGELIASSTSVDVEAAFAAGAPTLRVQSRSAITFARNSMSSVCPTRFATAGEFIDQCGGAFVSRETYVRVGVWLAPQPRPDGGSPVHFVSWGAPAPRAPTGDAFEEAFKVTDFRDPRVEDLTRDLPALNGARRVAAVAGWQPGTIRSCINGPFEGSECLEKLVSASSSLRWPDREVQLRLGSWRSAERFRTPWQVSQPQWERARALLAKFDDCRDRELPTVMAACLEAFSNQSGDVCAACKVPQSCDPTVLAEAIRFEGFPSRF
jgi:hypothetical protein